MLQRPSPKQIDFILNSNARMNIAEGSVRSGKSYACLLRAMREWQEGPDGEYMIVGKNETTILRNIVDPLQRLTGGLIRYKHGQGYFTLFDKKIYCVGANDERAVGKIQGATLAGCMVDEATILPATFWRMLMSRLSVAGAKCFATCNPDSPYHWLKTDYIDRAAEIDLKVWRFRLDDNPSLSETYKNNIRKEYSGLWYKRYVEGAWVLAEGSIYDFFDTDLHCVKVPPTYAQSYYMGIDYGTTNPFAAVLVGFNQDTRPNLWVEKEYYFDSRQMGYQKTDAEYAADIKREFGDYPITLMYLDPAAASFQVELKRHRLPVKQAKNEVLDGIRAIGNYLSNGDLVICKGCTNLIKEIEGYVWDERSVKIGEDKPVKQRDHACVVADTLITTQSGLCRISEIKGQHHQVRSWTGEGFVFEDCTDGHITGRKQRIVKLTLQNGKTLKATPDHEVMTKRGYIAIQDLLPGDEVLCYD